MSEIRLVFDRSLAAPREARHALREWLAEEPCPDRVRRDALTVLSELVTNAVVHARSDAVIVGMFDDGRLRIEDHDVDRSPPRITATAGADGGFGMRLVAALTDAWGWHPTSSGKAVWTEMLC